jgi:hypothetical protein
MILEWRQAGGQFVGMMTFGPSSIPTGNFINSSI